MITKDNLLDMLEKSISNEDEFVISYGKSFIDKIDQIDGLSNVYREEIKDYFQVLLQDSEKHSKTIKELIEKIEKDKRNEF